VHEGIYITVLLLKGSNVITRIKVKQILVRILREQLILSFNWHPMRNWSLNAVFLKAVFAVDAAVF
jgi:hypothetical protein